MTRSRCYHAGTITHPWMGRKCPPGRLQQWLARPLTSQRSTPSARASRRCPAATIIPMCCLAWAGKPSSSLRTAPPATRERSLLFCCRCLNYSPLHPFFRCLTSPTPANASAPAQSMSAAVCRCQGHVGALAQPCGCHAKRRLPCRPKLAARLKDPKSGRVLKVLTTAPAMQFYSGNYVEGVQGKGGVVYNQDSGICLETQVSPAMFRELCYIDALQNLADHVPSAVHLLIVKGHSPPWQVRSSDC